MPEPTWEYILKTQQEDFLERLKASLEFNPDYESPVYLARLNHDPISDVSSPCESINISFHPNEESYIDNFCNELAWKFCDKPDEDEPCFNSYIFINNKLGKIGEVAVKKYLGNWISDVDYSFYDSGDGGVDFSLIPPNNFIKIQVKTTVALRFTYQVLNTKKQEDINDCGIEFFYNPYKYIESSKWQVDAKALKNTHLTIFVLLMNEIIGDELNADPYKCILAGFLPNEKITPDRRYSIVELLYSGGIRSYLKHLINIHHQQNTR